MLGSGLYSFMGVNAGLRHDAYVLGNEMGRCSAGACLFPAVSYDLSVILDHLSL